MHLKAIELFKFMATAMQSVHFSRAVHRMKRDCFHWRGVKHRCRTKGRGLHDKRHIMPEHRHLFSAKNYETLTFVHFLYST